MSAADWILAFEIASLAGSALTAVKLFKTGLSSQYRFFFWYFLFRIPNAVWPLFFKPRSDIYFFFWVFTEPVTWIFHASVVLELFRLVLQKHKGLYSFGRWAMMAGVGVSVSISLISLLPRMEKAHDQSRLMFWYLGLERGIMLGLAILLMFLMAFLVLYTVPISRNIRLHARIYSLFFLSSYLAFLLTSVYGRHIHPMVNLGLVAVSAVCVFAWFLLLSPAGEEVQATHTILIGPEQERRILQQLDALNATLLRVSRN